MMQINARRLENSLQHFAELGKTSGSGVTRLAASDKDELA